MSDTPPTLPTGVFPPDLPADYALLDCGGGEKLERFGPWVLRRPDPQAMWRPSLDAAAWDRADLSFVRESDRGGRWETRRSGNPPPDTWTIAHRAARFVIRPTPFKHVGLFPEQSGNWAWTAERIGELRSAGTQRPALLNLFAYTGAATLLATQAGAFVTHVDASKPALRWAKENAAAAELASDAVRWIEDDVASFVRREIRRGKRYAGILLDPPPYGRGPGGEKWEFEADIVPLMEACMRLLSDGPAFVVLSCYAVGTSPLAFHNLLADLGPGDVTAGELAIPQQDGQRWLPAGLCGRWCRAP
jgi:23S rRNA (cytosine1962-C5)-methyltransferase